MVFARLGCEGGACDGIFCETEHYTQTFKFDGLNELFEVPRLSK